MHAKKQISISENSDIGVLDCLDKDFYLAILNMFKEPKETMHNKLKEKMRNTEYK